MDSSELVEVLSADGLRLLDSLPQYSSGDDVLRSVAELRKAGHSPARVAAVLSQSRLRARAEAKFGPFAARMLFAYGLHDADPVAIAFAQRRDHGLDRAELGKGVSRSHSASLMRICSSVRSENTPVR